MDTTIWDLNMAVNLRGTVLGCKYSIPEMINSGGGAIVNISSVASRFGAFGQCAYVVSKAGVEALTKYVALQYGKQSIRCKAVLPSNTMTPALQGMDDKLAEVLKYGICMPHFAQAVDIANAVAFLLSEEARCITGQAIPVDNGFTVVIPAGAVANFFMSTDAQASYFGAKEG